MVLKAIVEFKCINKSAISKFILLNSDSKQNSECDFDTFWVITQLDSKCVKMTARVIWADPMTIKISGGILKNRYIF